MKSQAQSQSASTATSQKPNLTVARKLAGLFLSVGVGAAAASTIVTSPPLWAQAEAAPAAASIPKLIRYSGTLVDGRGWPITTPVSVTFAIYAQTSGDEQPALWQETQQISPNSKGSYTALLGSVNPAGVPIEIFKSGESQYLGVKVEGETEQPRVLLVSVPYALKAADAATLGGLPASAYALAGTRTAASAASGPAISPDTAANITTIGGTAGYVPEFSGATTVVDSPVFVNGANVGIGTATPGATLDVAGSALIENGLTVGASATINAPTVFTPTGTATSAQAFPSQYLKLETSAYNSATASIVEPRFQWQAQVQGNDTAAPTATLDLATSTTAAAPAPTGFSFNANGTLNFAPGQTFPGAASITGVTAGTALTGGGTTGNVTLNLDTTKVPLLGTANTFVGNQSITGSAIANDNSAVTNSAGMTGNETAVSGLVAGVAGNARSTTSGAAGVNGTETAATGLVYGVLGTANSSTFDAAGVQGVENATTGQVYGVNGTSASSGTNSAGVGGYAMSKTGSVSGVSGYAVSTTNGASGIGGYEAAATGAVYGASGGTGSTTNGAAGVFGEENASTGQVFGVSGTVYNSTTNGAAGINGYEGAPTGVVYGVNGGTASTTNGAAAVNGYEGAATGIVYGVSGSTNSTTFGAAGVIGGNRAATGQVYGVSGNANSSTAGAAAISGNESAATGLVFGVYGSTQSSGGNGVAGVANSPTGIAYGVTGNASSTTDLAAGVYGLESATTGMVHGVQGTTVSTTSNAAGVSGFEGAASGQVYGVAGSTNSTTDGAAGVNGYEGSSTGRVYGLSGTAISSTNFAAAVSGYESATTGLVYGVYGGTASGQGVAVQGEDRSLTGGTGVSGIARATSGYGVGVDGSAPDTTGLNIGVNGTAGIKGVGVQGNSPAVAVAGINQVCGDSGCTIATGTAGQFTTGTGGLILQGLSGASLSSTNQVFSVDASGNGYFAGNLNVTGKVSKGSGSFKIDDPLDPANKYLSHSFVESPDMMDVYNGNITTDKRGVATVELPQYFEALNGDFRYQLTVIGEFAQAIVLKKVDKNHFTIRTSKPGVEVSWQVTGIRHDAYANANRIPVEETKPVSEQGYYLHPEVFGQPAEKSIAAARPAGIHISGAN